MAGATRNLDDVIPLAEAIEAEGHEITFKWWAAEGKIRHDDLRSEDLELVTDEPGPGVVEPESWTTTVRHIPDGTTATASGRSKVESHDRALQVLRQKLQLGWRQHPDEAQEIAIKEILAVDQCDVLVFVSSDKVLGAAIELGMALGTEKKIVVFRPIRESIFWYAPNVVIIEQKATLLDYLKAMDEEEIFS